MVENNQHKRTKRNFSLEALLKRLKADSYTISTEPQDKANLLKTLSKLWVDSPNCDKLISRILLNHNGNLPCKLLKKRKNWFNEFGFGTGFSFQGSVVICNLVELFAHQKIYWVAPRFFTIIQLQFL